jgi:hypothetical protein
MGKRWITIDCILPVLEMMDGHSHGIDLWEQPYTGLAWFIMGPPSQRTYAYTTNSTFYILLQSFSYSFTHMTLIVSLNSSIVTYFKNLFRYNEYKKFLDIALTE